MTGARNILFRGAILTFVILLSLSACSKTKATAADGEKPPYDTATYVLPMPEIPARLTSPEDRASFLADRYWDKMDWEDTLLLNSDRFMGESMATYGTFLNLAPRDKAASAVNALINEVSSKPEVIKIISDYAYRYFYYPDAPQSDSELYLLFVNPLLAQSSLSEQDRERLRYRKEEILKNRIGDVATDFAYVGEDGKSRRLLTTIKETEYNLLMFYDPECEVCEEAIKILTGSEAFTEAQKKGDVKVIAINAFGQEDGGKAHKKKGMPKGWIVGYSKDGEVDEKEIYSIRATPSIYVLDKNGIILQKELSLPKLRDFVAG